MSVVRFEIPPRAQTQVPERRFDGATLVLTRDRQLLRRYQALVTATLVSDLGIAGAVWANQTPLLAPNQETVVCLDGRGRVRGGFTVRDPQGGDFETLARLNPADGVPSQAELHRLGSVGELTSFTLDPALREVVDLVELADYAVDIAESLGLSHLLLAALARPRAYHLIAHLFGFRRISPFLGLRGLATPPDTDAPRAVAMMRTLHPRAAYPDTTADEGLAELIAATNVPYQGWRLSAPGVQASYRV